MNNYPDHMAMRDFKDMLFERHKDEYAAFLKARYMEEATRQVEELRGRLAEAEAALQKLSAT